MLSLITFIFILGVLIIVHELGHFLAAKRVGVKVEQFSLGFGPQLLSRMRGKTEYIISAVPLGGYVKLAGDNLEEYKGHSYEYLAQPPGRRFWIVFCGPLLNYLLGFLVFWLVAFVGYPTLTTKVGGLLDGFGAKEAGLQIGDRIVAVEGKKVEYWEDLQKAIQARKEQPFINLSVIRQDKEFKAEVRIREKNIADPLGQKHSRGLIGIAPFDEVVKVRHGFWESSLFALNKTLDLTVMTYKGLWFMMTGKLSMRDSVTGPLGIFFITSKVATLGIIAVLHLIAILSISLCIFNLLPLPILDGGHIFLMLIEKIRGRYISLKTERFISRVGVTMIVSLAVLVTCNDLLRLFGDKINKLFNR